MRHWTWDMSVQFLVSALQPRPYPVQDRERQSAVAGCHVDIQEDASKTFTDDALELGEHQQEEGGYTEPVPEHRRVAILEEVDDGMGGQAEEEPQRREDVDRTEATCQAAAVVSA